MKVGVLGAGMTGLSAVHYLHEHDVDVVAFEADDRPGGVIESTTVDQSVLERGPQRLRLSGPVESLVDEFDIRHRLIEGDDDQPLYAYYDGDLHRMPLSGRAALTTDLLSWRGKLRILLEPFAGPPQAGETVETFLTRSFGHEAATRFMGPLYSGLYGTDPDDMFVEYSLGRAMDHAGIDGSILAFVIRKVLAGTDTPPIVSFDDGLQTLPDAMYETYSGDIHLDRPATGIASDGEQYRIETERGTDLVDAVVVATSAPAAAPLLSAVAPAAAETVDRFRYNPIGVVHLRSDFDGTGHGFHIIDDGYETSGSTWNHSMLGRDGVFTSYIGSGNPALLENPDELGELAAEEFEAITGAAASVIDVSVVRPGMPAYDRSWTALEELSAPEGIEIVGNYTSRAGIVGRIVDGRNVAATLADSG